jgi:hypothetical protein
LAEQIASVEARGAYSGSDCECRSCEAIRAAVKTLRAVDCAKAALLAAPDVDPAKATRAQVAELHAANLAAYELLADPAPLSRRGDDREPAPQDVRDAEGG